MSDYQHKTNNGSVFINNYKDSDKHPDFRGEINVEGAIWEIAMWAKETRGGDKYYSLKVSPPRAKKQERVDTRTLKEQMDDEVPF